MNREFDGFRKIGVKFNLHTLRDLNFFPEIRWKWSVKFQLDLPLFWMTAFEKKNYRWVQSFAERVRILSWVENWKQRMRPGKELNIELEVAYHLGTLSIMMTDG